jgi:predicted methyltransferase
MKPSVPFLAALWFLSALPAALRVHAESHIPAAVIAAVADPRRPREQARRDAARKPAQLIAFAKLKAGDKVADFMPGNAYFTRIMSDVVGPAGHVYAFLPAEQLANCSPKEVAGTEALEQDPGYTNVSVLRDKTANFRVPEGLDVIWTAQDYHDLHDAFMGPADVGALNKAFFDALKPGGIYLVIDHVAESGSGLRDTESLHRIDPLWLRREIEAAGFILEAQSDVLRNPRDDHRLPVFDPRVRGQTDQVVLRFRKPCDALVHCSRTRFAASRAQQRSAENDQRRR